MTIGRENPKDAELRASIDRRISELKDELAANTVRSRRIRALLRGLRLAAVGSYWDAADDAGLIRRQKARAVKLNPKGGAA